VGVWTDISWWDIEQVRAALAAGADVNAPLDESQETPLVDAASFRELAVRHLVEAPMPWLVEPVWVAQVAGGTVAWQEISWLLVREEITAPLSRGGLLASTFAGGEGTITVHVVRDGEFLRRTEPIYEPGFPGGLGVALTAERWCRFGDRDAPAGRMARCLALMTMLTGIRVGEAWLRDEPKRVVLVTPPLPTNRSPPATPP
jgi:hypothetical protein